MARAKKSKSARIREYMEQHPAAGGKEIAKALKVPAALVYNVKANLRKKKPAIRRSSAAKQMATDRVVAAAQLIQACGGVEPASKALDAVEQVARMLD